MNNILVVDFIQKCVFVGYLSRGESTDMIDWLIDWLIEYRKMDR